MDGRMTAQQLKNSILQMAVQGKLVPQDPNDEPASVLLERIRKEKEQLIKEGKIKKNKNESFIFRGADNLHYEQIGKDVRCIEDELPFEIPNSWAWCRLGSILLKLTDGTHSTPKYTNSGVPFVSVKDISSGSLDLTSTKFISIEEHNELYKRCNPEMGDILLSKVGTTGVPVLIETDEQFSLFVSVALLKYDTSILNGKYLVNLINSPFVQGQCKDNTKGVGNKNWVMRDIANTLIVIPPYNEQNKIVDLFSKITPLTDKYAIIENQLNILNISIKEKLKKSVLQYAIEGKLVEQDPNDEPVSVLLDRIHDEKEKLIKDGKIKRNKNESIIFRRDNSYYAESFKEKIDITSELPFEIPDSWEWKTWGNISYQIQYGYNAPAKQTGDYKMLRISDIQNNSVNWNNVPFCEINETDFLTYKLNNNDILFARTGGTVGKSYLVKNCPNNSVFAGYLIRTVYSKDLNPYYLKLFMECPYYWSQLKDGTIATAQPNCNGQTLGKMRVPIPPKEEQDRIVYQYLRLVHLLD